MRTPTMKVVYAADGAYAPHLAASARSLLAHNPGTIDMFVLSCGLDRGAKELIRRHVLATDADTDRCEITFVDIEDATLSGFNMASKHRGVNRIRTTCVNHISAATFARLLLDEIDEVDGRVLYLDADTVVLDRLDDLWHLDLGGNALGARTDPVITTLHHELGVQRIRRVRRRDRNAGYFNAGVLLLDMDHVRSLRIMESARTYLREAGQRSLFYDQEALNAAVAGRYQAISPLWNVMTSDPGLEALRPDARIRHYSARFKPWTHPDHDVDSHHYFRYACPASTDGAEPTQRQPITA